MSDAAIISGSLVDVRNVGTHKSVKLTIHVPEEHATRIFAAFGWPTGVNPISVAIARLNEKGQSDAGHTQEETTQDTGATTPDDMRGMRTEPGRPSITDMRGVPCVQGTSAVDKARRPFDELSPAQQAGILCNERAFRLFLAEKFVLPIPDPDEAASVIRHACKVKSRSEIKPDNGDWSGIVLAYRLWQNHPELSDA